MKFDLVIGLCVWALASPAYPSQGNSERPAQYSTNGQQKQSDVYEGSFFSPNVDSLMAPVVRQAQNNAGCVYVSSRRGAKGALVGAVSSESCL